MQKRVRFSSNVVPTARCNCSHLTRFSKFTQFSIFVQQVAKHLAHTYGTKAPEVAKLANINGSRWPVVGKRLVEQFPYIEAEIRYGVQEYACTIVDFLARRTRLAFLNAQAAADAIPKIADIMAKEMNWSKAKKEVNRRESNLVPRVSPLPVPPGARRTEEERPWGRC